MRIAKQGRTVEGLEDCLDGERGFEPLGMRRLFSEARERGRTAWLEDVDGGGRQDGAERASGAVL